jgi:adenine-specific DNA-methyltransferase
VSRLTDLLAQVKNKDSQLGKDLEREFKVLASRRSFGLNFERHRPEAVELPQRPIRKGDKVRVLPERGSIKKGDQRLWIVISIKKGNQCPKATISLLSADEPETQEVSVGGLVVVAEFQDYIYPGLVSTGKVEQGGDKPFHTVINGENYHALKALTYSHLGKIDAIYIDPPYNTGAKDWKYNNDYVESEDIYRHSKWLAFMERRLKLAQKLLNPNSSALIVTIDEKEYLRLGMLLGQVFPAAQIQMVSSVINAKGIVRTNEFKRTNEFVFFVLIGNQLLTPEISSDSTKKVRWASLRRFEYASRRHGPTPRLGQFYPIYINRKTGKIAKVGEPLSLEESRHDVPNIKGCTTVFPLKPDGTEMIWGLTAPTLQRRLAKGYVKVLRVKKSKDSFTLYYLTSGQVSDIKNGNLLVNGHEIGGSVKLSYVTGKVSLPTTQWSRESHNAQSHGSNLLKSLLPDRSFPFPKSLYAVEDALRLIVADNQEAIILDFFSGSGTTAHAVMRLNHQDDGLRQCISVTNNEVAADEQDSLLKQEFRPGDPEWEKWGICDYIMKPRIEAAIMGKTPDGKEMKGDYKFTDEFPMSEGFEENAEFFTLTYETPIAINHNLAFQKIAPLLWMRAGSQGERIDKLPAKGWGVVETYGLLTDLDKSSAFCDAVSRSSSVRVAYIVTNDDRRFQAVSRQLPNQVEAVRLYESYITNFKFTSGD